MPPLPTSRLLALALALVAASTGAVAGCSLGNTGAAPGAPGPDGSVAASPPADDAGAVAPPPSLSDAASAPPSLPDAQPPPAPKATFLTLDTSQYLSAGDGGALTATAATAGANEEFALTDLNGGSFNDGDSVRLAAASGSYLSAADGGGGALTFSAASAGDDETFLLVRIAGPGPIVAGDHVALKTKVTGNYVSAINGGGGQVLANAPWDKAWETFTLGLEGVAPIDGGTSPGDGGTSASTAKQKVLAFLAGISGNHTAIGIEDKDSTNPHADSDTMASMAADGKNPSFWSADWGFGSAVGARETIVQEGERQWGQGAIVQYIYHACPLGWGSNEQCDYQSGTDPIKGSFGQLSDTQWADLTTPGGALNKVWLARLDAMAVYFQELKDAGVAPLFRPLHEINGSSANGGGWAWWQGRPGPTGSALLYRITHDYLAKTKGLDNIIWVWNLQDYTTLATDVNDYTPGAGYFDIVALDVYNTGYTQGNYDAMVGAAGGKPIGVAECQNLPGTGVLAQQPLWAYVAMWPDFFSANTSTIPALFGDPAVLTLASMPGWK